METFLEAPPQQVEKKIIESAKSNWSKPFPTPDQCKTTLKQMEKAWVSDLAKKLMNTILQEALEQEQIVFDDKSERPK